MKQTRVSSNPYTALKILLSNHDKLEMLRDLLSDVVQKQNFI